MSHIGGIIVEDFSAEVFMSLETYLVIVFLISLFFLGVNILKKVIEKKERVH